MDARTTGGGGGGGGVGNEGGKRILGPLPRHVSVIHSQRLHAYTHTHTLSSSNATRVS